MISRVNLGIDEPPEYFEDVNNCHLFAKVSLQSSTGISSITAVVPQTKITTFGRNVKVAMKSKGPHFVKGMTAKSDFFNSYMKDKWLVTTDDILTIDDGVVYTFKFLSKYIACELRASPKLQSLCDMESKTQLNEISRAWALYFLFNFKNQLNSTFNEQGQSIENLITYAKLL